MNDQGDPQIEIHNKADEVLILHAPDLYHTLKGMVDNPPHTFDTDIAHAAWVDAANLIDQIEQEAQTNYG